MCETSKAYMHSVQYMTFISWQNPLMCDIFIVYIKYLLIYLFNYTLMKLYFKEDCRGILCDILPRYSSL